MVKFSGPVHEVDISLCHAVNLEHGRLQEVVPRRVHVRDFLHQVLVPLESLGMDGSPAFVMHELSDVFCNV